MQLKFDPVEGVSFVPAGVAVGSLLPGGVANGILYVDSTGKLAESTNLVYNGTKLLLNAAVDDSLTGVMIAYGKSTDTGQMAHFHHPFSGQPYFLITSSDNSQGLFGVRNGSSAFFQCGVGGFRIEAGGGGLNDVYANNYNGTGILTQGVSDLMQTSFTSQIGDVQFNNNGTNLIVDDSAQSIFTNNNILDNFGAMTITAGLTMVSQITKYKNILTAGTGVPAIYAHGRLTAKTAAQASVATYTPTADGSFIVSANVLVTAATLNSFSVTCSYTSEDGTPRTLTFSFSNLTGTFLTVLTNTAGTGPYEGIPLHIRAKANTAITIATTGTFTTVTYNVEGNIRQIG